MEPDKDVEDAIASVSSLLSTAHATEDGVILHFVMLLNDRIARRQGEGNGDNLCHLMLLLHRLCTVSQQHLLSQIFASYVALIKGHTIADDLANEVVAAFLTFYYSKVNDFMNDLEENKPLTDIATRAMSVFNSKIAASIALISNKLTIGNIIKCYETMCYFRGVMHYYELGNEFTKENIEKFNENFRKIMNSATAVKNNYMVYRDTCLAIIKSRMPTTVSYIHADHVYRYNTMVKLGMSVAAISELQMISTTISSHESNTQNSIPLLIEVYLVALGDLFHSHSGYLYDQHCRKLILQSCTITVSLLRALCTSSVSDYIHSIYLKYCVTSLNSSTAVISRLIYSTCYAQLNDMYQMYIMNSVWNVYTSAIRLDNNLHNTVSISYIEGIVATIRDFFLVGSDEAAYALLMNVDCVLREPSITSELSFDNCNLRHSNGTTNTCHYVTAIEHLLSRVPYYSLRKRNSVFLQRIDAFIDISVSAFQNRRPALTQLQSTHVIPQGFALNILYGILKDFENSSQGAESTPSKLRLEPVKQTLLTWLNNLCRVLLTSHANTNKINLIKISGIVDVVEKIGLVLIKSTAMDPVVVIKLASIMSSTCQKLCNCYSDVVDTKCVYGTHEYHLRASKSLNDSISTTKADTMTKLLEASCLLISFLPSAAFSNTAVSDITASTIKQFAQCIQKLPSNSSWLMKSVLNSAITDMLQKNQSPTMKKMLQPYIQDIDAGTGATLNKCMEVSSMM